MDAFQKFDKDGNGHIDFQELKEFLRSTGDKMTDDQVDDFFREADVNKDGKINYKGKNDIMVLSNIDIVTPIPFGHFAIVLTSWYCQHLHLCR